MSASLSVASNSADNSSLSIQFEFFRELERGSIDINGL